MTSSRKRLLKLLGRESDVQLVFTAAGKPSEVVKGHSCVLKLWSGVLASMFAAVHRQAKGGSSSQQIIKIPMPGTDREDWLLAMEFVYPVIPAPSLTWDTVQTMLELASKYDMPALTERAGQFKEQHNQELSTTPCSKLFVWKWVLLTDKYRLFDVATVCMKSCTNLQGLVRSCPFQQLCELSSRTVQQLVIIMSGAAFGSSYCAQCKRVTASDLHRTFNVNTTTRGRCLNCRNYY